MHFIMMLLALVSTLFTITAGFAPIDVLPGSLRAHSEFTATAIAILTDKPTERNHDITPYDEVSDYLRSVCWPVDDASGEVNYEAPCNAMEAIMQQCTHGPATVDVANNIEANTTNATNITTSDSTTATPVLRINLQDFAFTEPLFGSLAQRDCFCASPYFDNVLGCSACMFEHGGSEDYDAVPQPFIQSLSRDYCRLTATPTAGLADILADWQYPTTDAAFATAPAPLSAFSDPIGTDTAVSHYWTAKFTGTAGYVVDFTNASGNASVSFAAPIKTNWDGIIVAASDTAALLESAITPGPTVYQESTAVKVVWERVVGCVALIGAAGMFL